MRYHETVLSRVGSDRASAYTFSNKSVTLNGRSYVVWTDAIALTRAATYDHAAGTWSEPITLGEGTDNHNSPSLTADDQGRLHLAYGPHGRWGAYADGHLPGRFKYCVGAGPGTWDGLERCVESPGYAGTYASLLWVKPGVACLTYRGGESPYGVQFQRTGPQGAWTHAQALMCQLIRPGYTHYGAILAADDVGTLYVAGHFYSKENGTSMGVAILKSTDTGRTWTDLRGEPTLVPIEYDDRFAVPHADSTHDPRIAGLCVAPSGDLWALSDIVKLSHRGMLLSRWGRDGKWQTFELADHLPSDQFPVQGSLCVDAAGRVHVVGTLVPASAIPEFEDPGRWWATAPLEVFHLWSDDDGGHFHFHPLSKPDPTTPNWLPSISRPGPYHPVEKPIVVYTHGAAKELDPKAPCRSLAATEVRAVVIDPTA